ncbi:MAG: AAC(3) family N-acetyltransferase [Bacteriovoracaceae bacterium]
MNLYKFADQTISSDLFLESMSKHIQKGSVLYVEFDLMTFGKIYEPLMSKSDFLTEIWSLLKKVVGPDGLVVSSTFSYSWGSSNPEKIFDVLKTRSQVGTMSEFLRQNQTKLNIIRTEDPMFSVVVSGQGQNEFAQVGNSSFGEKSIYEKMLERNAYLVTFGLNRYDPTFVHFVEQFFSEKISPYPHRSLVEFSGDLINKDGEKSSGKHYSFMRSIGGTYKFSDKKLVTALKEENLMSSLKIGGGMIHISDCQSVFKVGMEGLSKDASFFVEV